MNGVIILDKPPGFTSFDAVAVVRGLAQERKVGHTGTLDPMATGVLPLLLGKAAKACDLLPDTEKEYLAQFQLGCQTDTGDSTGKVLKTKDAPVPTEALERALKKFQGDILQVPPMYSAVSVGGKRLYELARAGVEIPRQARPVTVFRLNLESYDPSTRRGTLRVACSKGTYIRVLIEDIAKAAGTVGMMTALRRVRACGFLEEEAVPLDRLKELAEKGDWDQVLMPVESLFTAYTAVSVSSAQASRFRNGGSLAMDRLRLPRMRILEGMRFCIYGPEEEFLGLALADLEQAQLKFLKLFAE